MDELIQKYQDLPLLLRIFFCALIGLAIGWYFFINESYSSVQANLKEKKSMLENDIAKLERDKKNISEQTEEELEAKIKRIKNSIENTKKSLPSQFHLESIIRAINRSANSSGIRLMSFKPEPEQESSGNVKYIEMQIRLELVGSYKQIGEFFNNISKLDTMVQIKEIKMNQQSKSQSSGSENDDKQNNMNKLQKALASYEIKSNSTLALFRYDGG